MGQHFTNFYLHSQQRNIYTCNIQGWVSPRQKGISAVPWGEIWGERGEIGFYQGEMAETHLCLEYIGIQL